MTLSNCAYALRALMSSDVPVNDGFYRVLSVHVPPGTVANAQHPAAIGGGWETAFRVCETAFQALGQAVPERLAAGSKGALCNIAFGGFSPRTNRYYVFYEAMGGGYGARVAKDGIDAVQAHGQNTENSPIEETEADYQVMIVRYELIQDSEGAGRFRGGLGLRRDYQFDHAAVFSVLSDKAKFAPWGLAGGMPARPARYLLNPDGENRHCSSKTSVALGAGDVFSVQMGGGGGYGPPWERDPDSVLHDVRSERISLARAREAYGVVLDATTEASTPRRPAPRVKACGWRSLDGHRLVGDHDDTSAIAGPEGGHRQSRHHARAGIVFPRVGGGESCRHARPALRAGVGPPGWRDPPRARGRRSVPHLPDARPRSADGAGSRLARRVVCPDVRDAHPFGADRSAERKPSATGDGGLAGERGRESSRRDRAGLRSDDRRHHRRRPWSRRHRPQPSPPRRPGRRHDDVVEPVDGADLARGSDGDRGPRGHATGRTARDRRELCVSSGGGHGQPGAILR